MCCCISHAWIIALHEQLVTGFTISNDDSQENKMGERGEKKLNETGGSDYPILNWEETTPSY